MFLVYFIKTCFYLQKIQNQLEAKKKKSKKNTGGLCEFHMFSQTSISVYWEIQHACFANQTCPLKYAAQKYAWMDIPT